MGERTVSLACAERHLDLLAAGELDLDGLIAQLGLWADVERALTDATTRGDP